ncbi:YeeE/YedE family protein [Dyadobacter chenwenxiniae]|uniref:YeeE/YedE family protein n=1 Tax=Dyadobacter chenwenxiniae TaxID=2906456 RepID=A0A9X1PPC8_9BACT|nr:YeeE/YedE thiosulfate transporter family protein [Dyadobacter chenwenxiniae]MCF0063979.1 YeeE/YedE family protein [Dyadobacter chenwenxiniae]UON82707.1 YeeE/YedE family protein [Dyadobacter chenwenxiniae]
MEIIEVLRRPWPWYVAGPLIGLTVPALLLLGNKSFGISSSLRHICAAVIPANISFFKYDWKKGIWNLFFVAGITIGGFIASFYLANPAEMVIAEATQQTLSGFGLTNFSGLMPAEIFGASNIFSLKGIIFLVFGGFLVGFGTRYAGGCTSGHAITGLATLQWPSLVATVSFFIGGLVCTHWILPFLLTLTL